MKPSKGVSENHGQKERFFSIELESREDLRGISLTNGGPESVVIEGTIGTLQMAEFAEGIVLEVVGSRGVLRINIGEDDLKKVKG